MISERRVDFLSYETEDILVRITKFGMQRYLRTARLRPDIISSEPDGDSYTVCTFHCTKQQAEYYFASFVDDVEIISPKSLRDRFTKIYKNALNKYIKGN